MARKGVFNTLLGDIDGPENVQKDKQVTAPPSKAVQGLKSSLQDLQKASAQDIPIDMIMDSVIHDRIDIKEGIEGLIRSFDNDGQEVPIKVRMVPGDKPYEVVVGRRRLAAARALKWKYIKGFVTELDDKAMLKALTTENTARLDTSFIGRSQMCVLALEKGHSQTEVGDLLGVSQSLVSSMLRIYRGIGAGVIHAIGDAPGIGRTKWQTLHGLIEKSALTPEDIISLIDENLDFMSADVEKAWQKVNGFGSDREGPMPQSTKKFEVLLIALSKGPEARASTTTPPAPQARVHLGGSVQSVRKSKQLIIKVSNADRSDVLDFIEVRLPEIMEEFKNREK